MKSLTELIKVIKDLRDKADGNAWDIEQTFKSIAPYIVDEAKEVQESVTKSNSNDIKEELGDLLMLVIEMAQIGEDEGLFTLDDVASSAVSKLHKRLPHFFGDNKQKLSKSEIESQWQQIKKSQTNEIDKIEDTKYKIAKIFDTIPKSDSVLMRAQKILECTRQETFWWDNTDNVFKKIEEELIELKHEVDNNIDNSNIEKIHDELGDVYMMITTLATEVGADSDIAFSCGINKLETRLRLVEKLLVNDLGKSFKEATLNEREETWKKAKVILKNS